MGCMCINTAPSHSSTGVNACFCSLTGWKSRREGFGNYEHSLRILQIETSFVQQRTYLNIGNVSKQKVWFSNSFVRTSLYGKKKNRVLSSALVTEIPANFLTVFDQVFYQHASRHCSLWLQCNPVMSTAISFLHFLTKHTVYRQCSQVS